MMNNEQQPPQQPDETTQPIDLKLNEVVERFGPYRKPTDVTIPKYIAIQQTCQNLAVLIHQLCPESKQKSSALSYLEITKMLANAAVAIHEPANS